MKYVLIAIGIAVVFAILTILLVISVFRAIFEKLTFSLSNDDKRYVESFSKGKTDIISCGESLYRRRSELGIVNYVSYQVEVAGSKVLLSDGSNMLRLTTEEQVGLEAIHEMFGDANFSRVVFQENRVSFYANVCWKGLVYSVDGTKPKFYEKEKEIFKYRAKKVADYWYLLLA